MRSYSHNVTFNRDGTTAVVKSFTSKTVYYVELTANYDHTNHDFNGACDCMHYVARCHGMYQRHGASDESRCKHIKLARAELLKATLNEKAHQHRETIRGNA